MSESLRHPDGCFYFRSGGEIVGCTEDMSSAYPDDMIPPDDPEFVEKWKAFNETEYSRSRKAEYPPWADQLDHIFHNGVASWKTNVVQPVKDKYPKPE